MICKTMYTMSSDTSRTNASCLWFENNHARTCTSFNYISGTGLIHLNMEVVPIKNQNNMSCQTRKWIEHLCRNNFQTQTDSHNNRWFYIGKMLQYYELIRCIGTIINSQASETTKSISKTTEATQITLTNKWFVYDDMETCVSYTYDAETQSIYVVRGNIKKSHSEFVIADETLNKMETIVNDNMIANNHITYLVEHLTNANNSVDSIRSFNSSIEAIIENDPWTNNVVVLGKKKSRGRSRKTAKAKADEDAKNNIRIEIEDPIKNSAVNIAEDTARWILKYDDTLPLPEKNSATFRSTIVDTHQTTNGDTYVIAYRFDKATGTLMYYTWLIAENNNEPGGSIVQTVTKHIQKELNYLYSLRQINKRTSRSDIITYISQQLEH